MAETSASVHNKPGMRILILSSMVALISLLYYVTIPKHIYYHTLFRDLYFLPLILSALWFGLEGALLTAAAVTLIYLPFLFLNWQGFSELDFSRILEVALFNCVALALGYVSGRERAHQKTLRESESLAAMGKALSATAHDMKAPLTAIGGFTRSVHKTLQEEDERRRKLAAVIKEVDRLEIMVKEMLDFSQPLKLHLEHGDLNQLVRETLAIIESQAREKSIMLEQDLSGSLPKVDIDPLRVEQVLINLVVNALQASPDGEKVVVRTYRAGGKIHLEVSDHGPGVPKENRADIFLPFFTTKKEGTGLGLPIVMKILRAHDGTVEVLEADKQGATFRVSLPLKHA